MSVLELERLTEVSDLQPHCPQKLAELDLITPVPAGEGDVSPDLGPARWWQYRVCGLGGLGAV